MKMRSIKEGRDTRAWSYAQLSWTFVVGVALALGVLTLPIARILNNWLAADELESIERLSRAIAQEAPSEPALEVAGERLASALSDGRYAVRITLRANAAPHDWLHQDQTSTACMDVGRAGACLQVTVVHAHSYAHIGRRGILLFFVLALAGAGIVTFLTYLLLYRHKLAPLTQEMGLLQKAYERAKSLDMLLHDLRKPLRALHDMLEGVAMHTDAQKAQHALRVAMPSLRSMTHDVDQMLRSAGDGARTAMAQRASHTAESLLSAALRQCAATLGRCDIRFSYKLNHLRQVHVDSALTIRMLANLIANAAEAMGRQGDIWFATDEDLSYTPPRLKLTVGNSGSYIDTAEQERIFAAFYTRGKAQGTGLGLAFVKRAAELQGGSVAVRSDPENGTEFILTLPLDPERLGNPHEPLPAHARDLRPERHEGQRQVRTAHTPDSAPTRIVLVEDDVFVQESWLAVCDDAQLEVHTRPEDLLHLIKETPDYLSGVALIITDFYFGDLSELDGDCFARELRAHYQGPIILSSTTFLHDLAEHGSIDLVISKDARRWQELRSMLAAMAQRHSS